MKVSIRRVVFLFAVVAAFWGQAAAQESIGVEIKGREIEWSDFVGEVDPTSRFDAVTNWAITYRYSAPQIRDEKAYVKLTTRTFLRNNSWVRPNRKSDRLLEHERGHYKIGLICAKEIEETINSTGFDPVNYRQQIQELYQAVIKKYVELEKRYDKETNHYHNIAEQERWNKVLDEMLEN